MGFVPDKITILISDTHNSYIEYCTKNGHLSEYKMTSELESVENCRGHIFILWSNLKLGYFEVNTIFQNLTELTWYAL